ncbi:MAG: glycosyltransferase [Candidatus Latescibacterota bacterium]|jgi:glycosyltransferase involved in cell wall biosynthesis|nr:MAG: glycosyltransferase [Candidatus Latescibacterota bacterium]
MRILVFGDGSLGHTKRWAGYFLERRHDVLLLSFESVEGSPVPARRLAARMPTKLLGFLSALPAIRAETRRFGPDVVSALYLGGYGLVASLCGARPLAATSLGSDLLVDYPSSILHRLQIRRVLRRADLVITDADVLSEFAARAGARNVLKAYMGIDERIFHHAAAPRQSERPLIVSTRNLHPVYDVGLLVEAAPMILERRDASFVVCGDGPERERLKKRAAALGLAGRFAFAGRLDPEALAGVLREAAVYVSTSRSDSTSVSLLEAMACGVFPVVTDLPANREWIADGANGIIVPRRDPRALAEAVLSALGNDALRAAARERNAVIIAERGLWRDNMERVEEAFARLAGS